MYHTRSYFFRYREMLQKKTGVAIPLAIGLWGNIFCPLPNKITIALGKPMTWKIKEAGNPTTQELVAAHSEFCKELVKLFNMHKASLGYGDRELEIV